jgi:eukaryotic-like serine/threonine-protein kinase
MPRSDEEGVSTSPEQAASVGEPAAANADELVTLSVATGDTPTGDRLQAPPAFQTGEHVAGRYRIVRFLARGGMGEVYAAEDLELHETVALKTVRPEIATDGRAVERFKREIQLARKVTHPNVCRIFDLGVHRTAQEGSSGSSGGILFLTMELLEGETLAGYLRRHGRLSLAEALPLLRQMVAALGAAHRAGVVHRDLKSSNVLLVSEELRVASSEWRAASGEWRAKGNGQQVEAGLAGAQRSERELAQHSPLATRHSPLRAVVTDFGLARSSGGDASLTSMDGLRAMVGTPAYMAPEQVKGGETSVASDIYALGVVLYEMLTGQLPFLGELQAVLYRRLYEAPASPRAHVADLDARWEAAILRCLEREPEDRFQSVEQVLQAIEGEPVAPGRRQRQRLRRRRAAAAAALVALLGGAALLWQPERPVTEANAVQAKPGPQRRSVALVGFKNLAARPEAAWLSTALAEMLGSELAAGETFRLIPGENVTRMKLELGLPESDTYAPETLRQIRRNLAADLVVVGSYLALGEGSGSQLRLDLRVQETQAGETLAVVSETGTETGLLELLSRTGAELRHKLGIEALTDAEEQELRVAMPASAEAARLYAQGLERLRHFDALAARDRLQQAIAVEPRHPLLHAALAEAWSRLGYDEQVRRAAWQAFDLSEGLPRRERLLVEGRYREAAREWDKAILNYQTLFNFYPDNLELGLRLASAQVSAARGAAALETVGQLRRLPAPQRDDVRIDLTEAQAAGVLSDLPRQVEAAGRAAEKGRRQEAWLLVAEARLVAGWAYTRLVKPSDAEAAFDEAQGLFAGAGDQGGKARALSGLGYVLRLFDRDRERSQSVYAEALQISREIGDERAVASTLRGLALLLREEKKPQEARRVNDEALAIFRRIGDRSGMAWATTTIAYDLVEDAKLEAALDQFEAAIGLFREVGEKNGIANALRWTSNIYLKQGDIDRVVQTLDEIAEIQHETGNERGALEAMSTAAVRLAEAGRLDEAKSRFAEAARRAAEANELRACGFALVGLGDVLSIQGDLVAARKSYDEALQRAGDLTDESAKGSGEALVRAALGELAFLQGNLTEARLQAEQALQLKAPAGKPSSDLMRAHRLKAMLELEAGNAEQVETLARQGLDEVSADKAPAPVAEILAALARALLAQGRLPEAHEAAVQAMALAGESQQVWVQLTAAIIAARVQAASGKAADVEAALEALREAEARARQAGGYVVELEARLAQGEVEMQAGRESVGRGHLEALAREAAERGYGFYATKAAALL